MPRITVTVPDKVSQPYRFSLERQIVHFGRGDDNDVILDSGSVSSEHAVMERTIGGYILKDLGSTNGIKLNDERLDSIRLRNGQDIQIGDVDFDFLLSEDEMTALRLEDPTASLPPLDEDPNPTKKAPDPAPTSPIIDLADEPTGGGGLDLMSDPDAKPEPMPEPKPKPEPQAQQDSSPAPQPPAQQPAPQQQAPQQPAPPQQQAPQQQAPPQAAPQPEPQSMAGAGQKAEDSEGFSNRLIGILAVVAFLIGIAMHFQSSTDQSLIGNLLKKLTGG